MTKNQIWLMTLTIALLWAGAGCGHRKLIRPDSVTFIEPGVTTRAEIIDNFGPPTLTLESEKVLAYVWESDDPIPRRGNDYSDGHKFYEHGPQHERNLAHHVWSFCVAFDDSGKATRRAFLDARTSDELRATILRWAEPSAK